jgi:multidrug resistance efflux pump
MKHRIAILAGIGVLVFLIVLGIVAYFYWTSIAYVDTLHARVVGSLVSVGAPGTGQVVDLPLDVGDAVAQGEVIATLELRGTGANPAGTAKLLVPVRAPIAGVVAERATQIGDVLSPGQTIMTLSDPQQVWIRANVHETRIARVHVGQPARIYIRALNRHFPGRVEQIVGATTSALSGQGGAAQISTPSLIEVPVRISIASSGYTLYPGLSAEVRIQLSPRLP